MSGQPALTIQRMCHQCGYARAVVNGEHLRWRREQAGITLSAMARRLGFSKAYLSDVERNRRNVTRTVEGAYAKLVQAPR